MAIIGAFRITGTTEIIYPLVILAVRDEFSTFIVKELVK